jgi:integrase
MIRRKGRPGYWFRGKLGGKLTQRSLGTDYKNACVELERLRSLKTRERSFGAEGLPSNATVAMAAFAWLEKYVADARNEKGQKLAAAWVNQHLIPCLGGYVLTRLNSDHLSAYRRALKETLARPKAKDPVKREKTLAPQTVLNILSDVRCLLLWCEDRGYIHESPFRDRLMPRIQERSPDRVSDEDAVKLKAMPEPYGFVARLALGTGLRWGELCRAQASDLERGFLVVQHETKSGKIRRVPLEADLLKEVRNRVGRLVPFSAKSPGSFAKAVKRKVPGFHVHQMRHTFACQWLEKGRSLPALQQVLGHASIETTQRYARLSDESVMLELRKGSSA